MTLEDLEVIVDDDGLPVSIDMNGSSSGRGSFEVYANGVDVSTDFITTSFNLSVAPGAIPEPATLTIFSLGLAGLGYMRRRRAA